MKKGILVIVAIIVLGGVGAYLYVFNKPHRVPANETAAYQISAEEIRNDFINNQEEANEKYVDKVVEVRGIVLEVNELGVSLDNVVSCVAGDGNTFSGIAEGDDIVIKGRVIAFDDLLEEVKMDNCVKL